MPNIQKSWPPPCPECGGPQGELSRSLYCKNECDKQPAPVTERFYTFYPKLMTWPEVGDKFWVSTNYLADDRIHALAVASSYNVGAGYPIVPVRRTGAYRAGSVHPTILDAEVEVLDLEIGEEL